jgi:multidrug efflux pump subunit AcrA (membrane-fusion protein)
MVIVGVVAAKWDTLMNYYDRWTRPVATAEAARASEFEYYCAMHPNIIMEKPGKCPICGMPLSQRKKTNHSTALPEGVLAQVQLTPQKMRMGRIGVSPVEYQLMTREIRAVGAVDYDETRRAFITARTKGRIEKLLVNYVGQRVHKGDALAEIHSPDLQLAEEEMISAVQSRNGQSPTGIAAEGTDALIAAARQKLWHWGLTEGQIDDLIKRGHAANSETILAPISGIVTEKKVLEGKYVMEGDDLYTIADLGRVWLQAKIFESDLAGVSIGTAVAVRTTAFPNESYAGRITFIAYTIDTDTRTISARVEVDNPDYHLKPGMYAEATIRLPVGKVTPLDPSQIAAATAPPALPAGFNPTSTVQAYLALTARLAQDKIDAPAANALTQAAQDLSAAAPAFAPAQNFAKATKDLAAKGLEDQRNAIKDITTALVEILHAAPAHGLTLYIAHCPMANADWITSTRDIDNPYKGTDMLTCGSITGELAQAATTPATGPAAIQTTTFATGYYCPVTPDRLYDKPEHCPVDNFPTKFVQIEKVLAIPESAVIDTGTRKVVYRETIAGSGTFDMLAVTLGPRATTNGAEFYPVLAGLQAGDLVASQGTFLVDAENRLNPAAGVQFMGAAGAPSPEHKH